MTPTVQTVIDKALSQVGGYFPGRSPYGVWYDSKFAKNGGIYDAAQFCAMGLSWVFDQAGGADIFPAHAYTPSGVAAWKARGQWNDGVKGIQPGDIVYFDFPGKPDRVSHVGLAISSWRNGVDLVEFNTSGTAFGDQRNGRTVARKRRTSSIVGYGRPAYGSADNNITSRSTADIQRLVGAEPDGIYGPDTTAKVVAWQAANGLEADGIWGPLSDAKGFPRNEPAASRSGRDDLKKPFIVPTLSRGSKSEYVDDWQHVLREMGYTSVGAVDGDYGPKTTQATKNFQASAGLAADGVAGPITVSASLLRDGDRVLAEGDGGPDVVLLQFIVGAKPDGAFGPATRAAVQAVQRGFGVSPDGVVGPIFVQHYRKAAS